MVGMAFASLVQKKELDNMDIMSVQKDLQKCMHETKKSDNLSSKNGEVNGLCSIGWVHQCSLECLGGF